MDISVIVPLLNEEESLPELEAWIRRVMDENKFSYEIIFVDDGSTDASWSIIQELSKNNENIKALRFRRNYGKSPALNEGFKIAEGDVVITMDADLQDSPDEIPGLFDMIKNQGYDLVSGWKKKRYDSKFAKNIPSKFFNFTTRLMTGIKLHDFNCGLKAYRNDVVKNIEVFGEMHRYIPVTTEAIKRKEPKPTYTKRELSTSFSIKISFDLVVALPSYSTKTEKSVSLSISQDAPLPAIEIVSPICLYQTHFSVSIFSVLTIVNLYVLFEDAIILISIFAGII